jgi:hypothetical protein
MPFLETLSGEHGVGPVSHELDIAPSTYYWHQQRRKSPERRSCRDRRDAGLIPEIQRVYEENHSVYGVRKVWHVRGALLPDAPPDESSADTRGDTRKKCQNYPQ